MPAVPVARLSMFPVAVVAAASVALTPVAIPIATPNTLAAALVSRTQDAIGSIEPGLASAASGVAATVADVSVSAVGLLAHTPTLLRTVSSHELARFVALPAATTPLLRSIANGAGDGAGVVAASAPASVAAIAPSARVAATDPAADLLEALQSAFGKIQDAVVNAPGNVVTSIGQLLGGDVRTSLQTFTNILIEPLVLIGLTDLPNIAAPLAKLAPVLAPVINALPDIAINISLGALQLIIDVREGVADTYEGVRTGLSNGDLGTALNSFVTGLTTIAQKGINDVVGEYGIISSLVDAGDRLLKAIGQIGAPVATTTTAAAATDAATTAIAPTAIATTSTAPAATKVTAGTTRDGAATSKSETGATSSTIPDDGLGADPTPKSDNATKTDDSSTDDSSTDDSSTDDSSTDDSKTGTTKPDTTKPDTTKPGTTKTGSAKSDDDRPDTTKTGTTKTGAPKSDSTKTGATESSTGVSGSPAERDKTTKKSAAAAG